MFTGPIPPEVASRLKGLALAPRRAVGSRGIGLHASRNRGTGLEFAQYRAYEQGDEPRQIDWKLYARSDRYFVREAERESPVALWLLVDASASMAQADRARADWSRRDEAALLALCLAEVAMAQGDRFGWAWLDDGGLTLAAPAAGPRQRDRLRLDLARLVPAGALPVDDRLTLLWDRIGARDLVVLLSDCFDPAVPALARRLAAAGRDVAVVQVLTVEERDFPFAGGHRFRDPEGGRELLGDGAALRADYLRRFAEAQAALTADLAAAGVAFVTHVLDEPADGALGRLLEPRR